ncbi:MAG: hypothetical protein GY785_10485 [Gammaproteobacteria bacterium]|nr:hypothetical protein [Gammaproteobacteria bacterium]
MNNRRQTRIAVDIGGIFTDIALDDGSSLYTAKTLTTRDDPVRGVVDVIRIANRDAGCAAQSISSVIHGTTLATNALIERKGAHVGLITTARGCFGGKDGAPGHLQLASGKLMQGKGKQQILAGEVLVFQTPGGGGYGDPHKRPVAEVARDYAAGLISKAALERDYGVLLKADGRIDGPATREQRRKQPR